MVVLATNRPGDLDDAVLDRMDEAIHFDLPGRDQRKQLLGLYLDKYINKAGTLEVRTTHCQTVQQAVPLHGSSVSRAIWFVQVTLTAALRQLLSWMMGVGRTSRTLVLPVCLPAGRGWCWCDPGRRVKGVHDAARAQAGGRPHHSGSIC
jgi:hypothetical protein